MLAIQYKPKVELYNWFGCYQKGNTNEGTKSNQRETKASPSGAKRSRVTDDVFVLSPTQQDILHNTLKSLVVKTENGYGFRYRPDIIAYLLMGRQVIMNIRDSKVQKTIEERYSDITYQVKPKEPDESGLFNSIVQLRHLIRNTTKGAVVKIITLGDLNYSVRIPDYMSILMSHFSREGHLHTIPINGTKADENDIFYRRMFRRRIYVTRVQELKHYPDPNDVMIIPSATNTKELNAIENECQKYKLETVYPDTSELNFGNGCILRCSAPISIMEPMLNTSYQDIFKICMYTCRRLGYEIRMFSPGAKLIGAYARTDDIRSVNATIICDKIIKEIKSNKPPGRVNIIMIGNKGEGKSTASNAIAEMIEHKFGVKAKAFSSDSYGRWLAYLCDKYGVTHPSEISDAQAKSEIKLITQESEKELDQEGAVSWYETQAITILMSHNVTSREAFSALYNRSSETLTIMKNEFKEIMVERMENKATLSFGAYFEALQSAAGDNRVSIFECHTTEESKQVARADITFRLEPLSNGLGNLIQRKRGTELNTLAEMFLHTVYEDQIGRTNPGVYLSEI